MCTLEIAAVIFQSYESSKLVLKNEKVANVIWLNFHTERLKLHFISAEGNLRYIQEV